MPPAGKRDRPDPNTSRIRAKRTKNTRLPLGEIQAVNQREVEVEDDDDEDNADATGDGVAPDKEAALVAAAVAGLFEEDARAGVVHDENVAPPQVALPMPIPMSTPVLLTPMLLPPRMRFRPSPRSRKRRRLSLLQMTISQLRIIGTSSFSRSQAQRLRPRSRRSGPTPLCTTASLTSPSTAASVSALTSGTA